MKEQEFYQLCREIAETHPDWIPNAVLSFQYGMQEYIGELKTENSHLSAGLATLVDSQPKTISQKLQKAKNFAIQKLKMSRSLPNDYLNKL